MFKFHRNLSIRGRIVRGAVALLLTFGAYLIWHYSLVAAVALALSSAFVAFEALRGWCALRACGVKTRF